MSPIEDYFFSNNIQVWSHKVANSLIWYNTSDGQFIRNGFGHLYQDKNDRCERVI